MYESAKNLLRQEFDKCCDIVNNDRYCLNYAQEKWTHSMQVMGAGNLIVKNEEWFRQQPEKVRELAKTAILLHDIGRFEEIIRIFHREEHPDHGILGYEKLRLHPLFNIVDIYLPIKHHGHMIEVFYNDPEYLDVKDQSLRERLQHIIFAIRDADKIANFNLIMNDRHILDSVFVVADRVASHAREITPDVLEDFLSCRPILNSKRQTCADYMLSYIGWMFDINYRSSYEFCRRLKLLERMFAVMPDYHDDRELDARLRRLLETFLQNKFSAKL